MCCPPLSPAARAAETPPSCGKPERPMGRLFLGRPNPPTGSNGRHDPRSSPRRRSTGETALAMARQATASSSARVWDAVVRSWPTVRKWAVGALLFTAAPVGHGGRSGGLHRRLAGGNSRCVGGVTALGWAGFGIARARTWGPAFGPCCWPWPWAFALLATRLQFRGSRPAFGRRGHSRWR